MYSPKSLYELYSGDDLSTLFKGGFINFGYWDPAIAAKEEITIEDVIAANNALYKQAIDRLEITQKEVVLEVGSGHGAGCAFAAECYAPKKIIGLDYFQSHVDIAINRSQQRIKNKNLIYLQGKAEAIPFPSGSIDKLYTVEAFQHFEPHQSISEFYRVLKASGKFVICTFFAREKACFPEILKLLPSPAIVPDQTAEPDIALPEVLNLLAIAGFHNIRYVSIGKYVWNGYHKWVSQNAPSIWDTHWLTAYQRGLLDYYVIEGSRVELR